MPIKVLTPSDRLPVTMTRALRHLRALPEESDLVVLYIKAATEVVEDYTGRALVTQSFVLQLPAWPTYLWTAITGVLSPAMRRDRLIRKIALERSPLIAVQTVKYWPQDGSAQLTWDASNYAVDTASLPGNLVINDGVSLPCVATRTDAVEITFTAGYGVNESDIPATLVACVLQLGRHIYDNPGTLDSSGKMAQMPNSFDWFLKTQKVTVL